MPESSPTTHKSPYHNQGRELIDVIIDNQPQLIMYVHDHLIIAKYRCVFGINATFYTSK